MIPQHNALVLKIAPVVAAAESFDGGGETVGAPVYEAPADVGTGALAYITEKRDRTATAQASDVRLIRSLIVANDDPPIEWAVGLIVDYQYRGQLETGRVQLVERRAIDDPAMPPELQTTRLTLEPR